MLPTGSPWVQEAELCGPEWGVRHRGCVLPLGPHVFFQAVNPGVGWWCPGGLVQPTALSLFTILPAQLHETPKAAQERSTTVGFLHQKLSPALQDCDRSNDERLEGAEIQEFLRRLLKRPELEAIFHRYSGEDRVLSTSELQEFLEDQGEESPTLDHAERLIQTYELNETGGGLATKLGFMQPLTRWAGPPSLGLRADGLHHSVQKRNSWVLVAPQLSEHWEPMGLDMWIPV